jgi:hypothetical protein
MSRFTYSLLAPILLLLLAGCGGAMNTQFQGPEQLGAADQFSAGDFDFISELEGANKATSATYTYYFRDGIGWKTLQTWDILSNSGNGAWNYNATDAVMQFGTNYGAGENDELITPTFILPANFADVKLVFQTRYSFGAGDSGKVQFSGNAGANWVDLGTFTGTSGAGTTPPWVKKLFFLPAAATQRTALIRFVFNSDGTSNGYGWGINSLAVYRTDVPAAPTVSAPTNLTKAAGPYAGTTRLSWQQSGAQPLTYRIYRSSSQSGTYTQYAEIQGSLLKLTVPNGSGTQWYQVRGFTSANGETMPTNSISVP